MASISKLALYCGDYEVLVSAAAPRAVTTPIAVSVTDTAAPRMGSYVYTICRPHEDDAVGTALVESDPDNQEMCRSLGRVLALKWRVPVYTNINGQLDSGSYKELVRYVTATVASRC